MKRLESFFKPVGHASASGASTSKAPDNPDMSERSEHINEVDDSPVPKCLRLEPNKPRSGTTFPVTNNRKYCPEWMKTFPWLEYDTTEMLLSVIRAGSYFYKVEAKCGRVPLSKMVLSDGRRR